MTTFTTEDRIDAEKLIIKEKDGSLTVNVTGEITIKGKNNDQERQKPTKTND
jgi:hypothetical protein